MMKRILPYIITAAMITAVILILGGNYRQARRECQRYRENVEVLSDSVRHYRTAAGKNAARAGVLQMELSEYKKLRAGDLETIKGLRVRIKDITAVSKMQSQTIVDMRGIVRDSIVYRDRNIIDTLRCVRIRDPWYILEGCSDKAGKFTGTYAARDSIVIVETVRYKRFLGFLWKTKKIKDRQFNVVNANPYTTIAGMEHIIIEK